jgi:hypothetical protein
LWDGTRVDASGTARFTLKINEPYALRAAFARPLDLSPGIESLADRVRMELRDYRDLRGETFDKIVSVGMVEHVGREQLGQYFRTADDALREGGLARKKRRHTRPPAGHAPRSLRERAA